MVDLLASPTQIAALTLPNWGPSGEDVYRRTYSRTKADGTKETWADTVERVVLGSLAWVPQETQLENEAAHMFDLLYNMKVIPAGRHLSSTGVEGRAFNRSCHRAGWSRKASDHFTFLFSELLKGGGVGANYSSEYLTPIVQATKRGEVGFRCRADHPDAEEMAPWLERPLPNNAIEFVVEDSREGWIEAVRFLIDKLTDDSGDNVIFDVSLVRPRGARLVTMGGTASGPGPLLDAMAQTYDILSTSRLDPLTAMDIDHALSSCVVAGGTRRSARMSILHWNDPFIFDFIDCKRDHSKHWTTNISVEIDDAFLSALHNPLDPTHDHATKVFNTVTEMMLLNGEPGFYNSSLSSVGERGDVRSTNPCGEIPLEAADISDPLNTAGGESCNLGHVNLSAFGPGQEAEAEYAFSLMARFLMRATFAPLSDTGQAAIENRNRRIGVGIFGFQEWAASYGIKYSDIHKSEMLAGLLRRFEAAATNAANAYADELGVPRPIKTTTVAPTGTIAKLPGTTEGIHPIYARYFERRIRYQENDPILNEKIAAGFPVEQCIYAANTKVVVTKIKDPILEKFPAHLVEQADEIDVEVLCATQAFVQEHYANNAVSCTLNVSDTLGVDELRAAISQWLPKLKGTTVMVDASRPQSPYTRITEEEWAQDFHHIVDSGEMECASGVCPIA